MHKKTREYLDMARSAGFNVDPLFISRGHWVVDVSKDSVSFQRCIPASPSDHRGPRNFLQDLKREYRRLTS